MTWDRKQLKDTVAKVLGKDTMLVIAANREPYVHVIKEGKIECDRPTGGVATALDPVMQACGGLWVAHGRGSGDRKVVDKNDCIKVPPDNPGYTLKRIWLNKEEEKGYYFGFSNSSLWPLCHLTYTRPSFNENDWNYYKLVNQRFADVILKEIKGRRAVVWIHDFHLTLLAQMIKKRSPDVLCIHSWHIPWPNSEVFRICPKQKEIIEALLCNDLLGFHIRYHCENFFDNVDKVLEARIDREKYSVIYNGHETFIRAFPISADFRAISEISDTEEVEKAVQKIINEFSLEKVDYVLFGLDRLDYTKGIPERLLALDKFLEKYPEYRKRIVFIQIGELSRIQIQEYKNLNDGINALMSDINWKYSVEDWSPVILLRRHVPLKQILAFFRLARACIVSPLHDGMNLVSKEFISSRVDEDGVLILSKFTGAARELSGAIFVNPYDIDDFADKIKQALELPKAERTRRMKTLRGVVKENNIYKWAGKVISEIKKIQK